MLSAMRRSTSNGTNVPVLPSSQHIHLTLHYASRRLTITMVDHVTRNSITHPKDTSPITSAADATCLSKLTATANCTGQSDGYIHNVCYDSSLRVGIIRVRRAGLTVQSPVMAVTAANASPSGPLL
jgi:hypothetical protein